MDSSRATAPAIRRMAILPLLLLLLCACRQGDPKKQLPESGNAPTDTAATDPGIRALENGTVGSDARNAAANPPPLESLPDTAFVRLAEYSDGFAYEMRYATANNFLKSQVYPCAECYTRAVTARALIAANAELAAAGFRIRFFDCYRPNSVQFAMWEIVPNPQYVADPVKGSIHNKGGAVDITLETLAGQPLEMGTDFDFFGPRAHHDFTDLPPGVLVNRKMLKETMERHGFWSIRTEWWHYNLSVASNYPVSDFRWPCPSDPNPTE